MNKGETIQAVLAEIQRRWGHHSIQPARKIHADRRLLATGITPLDALLCGGLPLGKISAFVGRPTSGATTLAYRLAAQVHAGGGEVVYLDLDHTFNGAYAANCGVDTDRLLVARPPAVTAAFELTHDVIASHIIRLIVVDLGTETTTAPLKRLVATLAVAPTVLLLLAGGPISGTHVRLHLACERWIYQHNDVVGCQLSACVAQHPQVPVGQSATFPLCFARRDYHV